MAGQVVEAVSVAGGHPVIGNSFLTATEIANVSAAVEKAERGTSGEIVPMIVKRSSAIGHLPYYIGFILFSLALIALLEWNPPWFRLWWGLPVVGVCLACFILGMLLARIESVQRWLIPVTDRDSQTWNRAHAEWAANHLKHTEQRTGILLFVSIMERKAIILADEGIAKHYPESTWQEVIDILSEHLHRKEWSKGFETAIIRCGEILRTYLPAQTVNTNEISDRIIIKE